MHVISERNSHWQLLSERSLRRRACATSTGSKSRLWLLGLDWNQADAKSDRPVGIGALVTVDTTVPVDVNVVASAVRDRYDRMINLR
jgi:hypothetical protein